MGTPSAEGAMPVCEVVVLIASKRARGDIGPPIVPAGTGRPVSAGPRSGATAAAPGRTRGPLVARGHALPQEVPPGPPLPRGLDERSQAPAPAREGAAELHVGLRALEEGGQAVRVAHPEEPGIVVPEEAGGPGNARREDGDAGSDRLGEDVRAAFGPRRD